MFVLVNPTNEIALDLRSGNCLSLVGPYVGDISAGAVSIA